MTKYGLTVLKDSVTPPIADITESDGKTVKFRIVNGVFGRFLARIEEESRSTNKDLGTWASAAHDSLGAAAKATSAELDAFLRHAVESAQEDGVILPEGGVFGIYRNDSEFNGRDRDGNIIWKEKEGKTYLYPAWMSGDQIHIIVSDVDDFRTSRRRGEVTIGFVGVHTPERN